MLMRCPEMTTLKAMNVGGKPETAAGTGGLCVARHGNEVHHQALSCRNGVFESSETFISCSEVK
jgi:hypothetical protein